MIAAPQTTPAFQFAELGVFKQVTNLFQNLKDLGTELQCMRDVIDKTVTENELSAWEEAKNNFYELVTVEWETNQK